MNHILPAIVDTKPSPLYSLKNIAFVCPSNNKVFSCSIKRFALLEILDSSGNFQHDRVFWFSLATMIHVCFAAIWEIAVSLIFNCEIRELVLESTVHTYPFDNPIKRNTVCTVFKGYANCIILICTLSSSFPSLNAKGASSLLFSSSFDKSNCLQPSWYCRVSSFETFQNE